MTRHNIVGMTRRFGIYSYNRSQQDALFINFILVKNSTYFGQTYCPSSGVLILYSQQLVFVKLVCWLSASEVPTRPKQIREIVHLVGFCYTNTSRCTVLRVLNSLGIFTFVWTCIVTNFFIKKPTRCTTRKLSTNLYDIYHCWVYSE
jgi:hypothetical protein